MVLLLLQVFALPSLTCSQDFPHLRDLNLCPYCGADTPQPFSSVEWPEGEHYPAMDSLRTLTIHGDEAFLLLLPPVIDLRGFSGLRHVRFHGDMHAEGDEAQRRQVLRLQPHVTVGLAAE